MQSPLYLTIIHEDVYDRLFRSVAVTTFQLPHGFLSYSNFLLRKVILSMDLRPIFLSSRVKEFCTRGDQDSGLKVMLRCGPKSSHWSRGVLGNVRLTLTCPA